MKYLLTLYFAFGFATITGAATIDVGGITFDETAFVDRVQLVPHPSGTSGVTSQTSLIGSDLDTAAGMTTGNGFSYSLLAKFFNPVFNGDGIDLYMFLPSGFNVEVGLSVGATQLFAPVDRVSTPNAQTSITTVIGIDLSDLGVASGSSINTVALSSLSTTSFGAGNAYVSALGAVYVSDPFAPPPPPPPPPPPAPVPLPAGIVGLLTVLGAFGLLRRRQSG